MHPLYDKFCKLCGELAIKNRIDPILAELYAKRDGLEAELNALRAALQKEQTDVDKIEGVTLSSVFYTVIGQKDRKLEKEKSEAAAAEEVFSAQQSEISELNEEIKKYEHELRTVRGCDLRYGRLLPQILDELRTYDSPESKEVLDTFDTLTRIEKKVSDFEKALELCYEVLANLSGAAKHLTRAETDLQNLSLLNAEHNAYLRSDIIINLEKVKPIVDTLCRQIKRLDADLVGSHLDFDIKIEIGNYSDDISEWKAEVEHLIPQIKEIQRKLREARDRWAKVAGERRTELHEQIKAVLE